MQRHYACLLFMCINMYVCEQVLVNLCVYPYVVQLMCLCLCICVCVCVCVCKGISYVYAFSLTRIQNKEEIQLVVSTIAIHFVFFFHVRFIYYTASDPKITDAGGKDSGSNETSLSSTSC